jgi:hypothetical protein
MNGIVHSVGSVRHTITLPGLRGRRVKLLPCPAGYFEKFISFTKLHGVTFKKTVISQLTTVRISSPTKTLLIRISLPSTWGLQGHTQAVSPWLPTAAAQVRAQVRSCGICGGQSRTGAGFLRVVRFPLPILIPPTAPHSSSIIRGWYNRPVSDRYMWQVIICVSSSVVNNFKWYVVLYPCYSSCKG